MPIIDVVADPANYPVTFKTSGMFDCIEGLHAKSGLETGIASRCPGSGFVAAPSAFIKLY